MANKGKKLSLEEARAMFSANDQPSHKSRKNSGSGRSSRSSHSSKPYRSKSSGKNRDQISQRITMLERKVMEGDLSTEEEQRVLEEIDRLEHQLK